jgi:hypothetical protein
MMRWGNPGGSPYGRYPFGVTVEEEAESSGLILPSVIRAGWWWEPKGRKKESSSVPT